MALRRGLAFLIAALLAGQPGCQPAESPPTAWAVTVDAGHPRLAVPGSFLGFGLEYDDVLGFTAGSGTDVPLTRLLARLEQAAAGPAVIRLGGNSTDESWWNPAHEARPPGVTYDLDQPWLDALRTFASRSDASFLLGLNLALDRPDAAVAFAQAASSALGSRIDAFEAGNEPDFYPRHAFGIDPNGRPRFARPAGYGAADYAKEYEADAARLRAALGRPVALAGPAAADAGWLRSFPAALGGQTVDPLTYHQYPLSACGKRPGGPGWPAVSELVEERASHGLAATVAPFVAEAAGTGSRLRVDEVNSVVCLGAEGVSDTFASALWVADLLFEYASAGVAGVNLQANSRASYTPFRISSSGGQARATVNPEFYGILLAAQALRAGARLLPVKSARGGGLKAWATIDAGGTVRIVLLNKGARAVRAGVSLGGAAWRGSALWLTASGLGARSGVRLGGQTFGGADGTELTGTFQSPSLASRAGLLSLDLAPASAVLLVAGRD